MEESPEYTARSQQRYMERQVRRYKSRMAAAVTPQSERQAYNLVRRWQGRLRQHIADNADKVLPRQYWREGGRQNLRLQSGGGSGKIHTKVDARGNVVNPMDRSLYEKIRSRLNQQGIVVIQAKGDDLRFLKIPALVCSVSVLSG